jgi:hypothetical protein
VGTVERSCAYRGPLMLQGGRIIIEVGFKFTANLQQVTGENPPFTLDDPVLGQLDVAELPGGDVWIDISDSFIDGLEISRGRNRSVDLFRAGTASFRLDNRSRLFDPFNSLSPFFGNLTPMRPVRISVEVGTGVERLFVGFVTDWLLRYGKAGDAWVECECVDAFVGFASDNLETVVPVGAGDTADVRIGRVLDEVGFGPQRDLSAGTFVLADTEFGRNALVEMQEASESDSGLLFMSRSGVVTYRTPTDVFGGPMLATFGQSNTSDGDIGYADVQVSSASELLYNIVRVNWDGGTVERQDAGSVDAYLPRTLTVNTGLANEDDAELLAEFLLIKYAHPEVRFDEMLVRLHDRRLSDADRMTVARLEVGGKVQVFRRPPGAGVPDEYAFVQLVEGLRWVYDGQRWTVTVALGDVLGAPFTLDDLELGALDTGGILTF